MTRSPDALRISSTVANPGPAWRPRRTRWRSAQALADRQHDQRVVLDSFHGFEVSDQLSDLRSLPFDHDDLFRLVKATSRGVESMMDFFGGKERDLLQAA